MLPHGWRNKGKRLRLSGLRTQGRGFAGIPREGGADWLVQVPQELRAGLKGGEPDL